MVVVAWSSAGDVVAGFVETAELFDVDVDQLAGMAAAIPIRFNTVVTVDNAMSSFSAICGPVMRQLAQLLDERFGLGRCVRRRRARPRRPIRHRLTRVETSQPLLDGALTAPSSTSRVSDLSAVLANSSTHQLALKRTKTGVTVKIHGSP